MSFIRIKQFNTEFLNLAQIICTTIKGNIVALCDDTATVSILDIKSEDIQLLWRYKLSWQPNIIQISPSSRYILIARKYHSFELWDIVENRLLLADSSWIATEFIEYGHGEVFLLHPKMSRLDAYKLSDITSIFSLELPCEYYFLSFLSEKWLEAEYLFAIGYPKGESKDELERYSFKSMRSNIDEFAKQFSCNDSPFFLERGYPIGIGYYKADHIVIFRDSNDDYYDKDAADDLQIYILRTGETQILQKIIYRPSMKVDTAAPIFATDSNFVLLGENAAEIISKTSGQLITTINGDCMAIDGKLKLLIVVRDKQIEILSVL